MSKRPPRRTKKEMKAPTPGSMEDFIQTNLPKLAAAHPGIVGHVGMMANDRPMDPFLKWGSPEAVVRAMRASWPKLGYPPAKLEEFASNILEEKDPSVASVYVLHQQGTSTITIALSELAQARADFKASAN